jgi:hypothetical protein
MGFVIRALFVVGVLYLISPLRAPLPDWLAKPSAASAQVAARTVTPTLVPSTPLTASVETLGNASLAACKGHEKACLDAAASALKPTDGSDPLAALLNEASNDAAVPSKSRPVTLADAVPDIPAIPLPPRRETAPALPATGQKKI